MIQFLLNYPKNNENITLEDNAFIFIAGLHRSGTSLLHEVLREHTEVSGFSQTGVYEDEGQKRFLNSGANIMTCHVSI